MELGFCQRGLGLVEPARTSFQHARQFDVQGRDADAALRELYRLGFWQKLRSRLQNLFGG
jgi:hypothetical protein